MKLRILLVIAAAIVLVMSLSLAQDKENCAGKASCDMKTAATKSCCKDGAKASATSASQNAKVIFVSDKKTLAKTAAHCPAGMDAKSCTMKSASATGECSEADKAQCEGKASMTKASGKMDCCKAKTKTLKAEKKSQSEKSDGKGTN